MRRSVCCLSSAGSFILLLFILAGCSDREPEVCLLKGFSVDGQQYEIRYGQDGDPSALVLKPDAGTTLTLPLSIASGGGISRIDLPPPLGPGFIANDFDVRNNLIRSDKIIDGQLQTRREFLWNDSGQLLEINIFTFGAGLPEPAGKVVFTYTDQKTRNPEKSVDYDADGSVSVEADYKYDRNKTPFGTAFGFLFNVFSENNITRATYRQFGTEDIVLENSHTYNSQGYPVLIILRESSGQEKVQSYSYDCP